MMWVRSEVWPLINDLCSLCAHFRIVRNKAAEKVKEIGGYESSSPGPLSGSLASDTSLPLRHPSYSINNILGVQQTPDANENILKRKREDDGRQRRNCFYFHFTWTFLSYRREPRRIQPVGASRVQAGAVAVQLGLQQLLHGLLHVGRGQVDGGQPVHKAGEGLRQWGRDDGWGEHRHHHLQRLPCQLSVIPGVFPRQPSLLIRRGDQHQHVLHGLQCLHGFTELQLRWDWWEQTPSPESEICFFLAVGSVSEYYPGHPYSGYPTGSYGVSYGYGAGVAGGLQSKWLSQTRPD